MWMEDDISCIPKFKRNLESHFKMKLVTEDLCQSRQEFPLQNFGWFMKLLLKKRRMCLWVIIGLTLQSSLLCCHMISFLFTHSFISYHILLFLCSKFFSKSLFTYHIFVTVTYLRFLKGLNTILCMYTCIDTGLQV